MDARTSWDEDCSAVLAKFPPQLRNRISEILTEKGTLPVVKETKTDSLQIQKPPKGGGVPVQPPLLRAETDVKKTKFGLELQPKRSVCDDKAAHTVVMPSSAGSEAADLTPNSKREHVTR